MDAQYQWDSYRTLINEQEAFVMVNIGVVQHLDEMRLQYALSFSLPFDATMDGQNVFESQWQCEAHLDNLSQTLLPLIALSNTILVGFIIIGHKTTVYFYSDDPEQFKTCLDSQHCQDFSVQHDPHCDIYFDFLLPSPLEMKINATAQTLESLSQEGANLDLPHPITHKFQFDNADKMQEFIDYCMKEFGALDIHYTQEPVQENDETYYLVILQHDLVLRDDAIFEFVKTFDNSANQFEGEYNGWECQIQKQEKPLH
ncbi:TIGR01619 family protein [Pasteurellaceae bacterium HPA106]|uniref:TIGR01619 family protein n=1 Tax=Spirabiliibacterium pneumoniae TaxID=221400 RepID=UPI001AAC528C|nr:TIGR01619 family protein [Spirabiliibacterium pneumoniae]MBE2896166.1 TIGR01619 family protein [Spirabiliibacterium pneumoniae]